MRACANDSGSSPDECTRSAANTVSEPTRRKRSNGRTEREQRADPSRLASDLLLCFHSRAIGVDPSKLGLEAHHDKAAARTADVKAEYEATDGGDGSQSQYAAAQATRRHGLYRIRKHERTRRRGDADSPSAARRCSLDVF